MHLYVAAFLFRYFYDLYRCLMLSFSSVDLVSRRVFHSVPHHLHHAVRYLRDAAGLGAVQPQTHRVEGVLSSLPLLHPGWTVHCQRSPSDSLAASLFLCMLGCQHSEWIRFRTGVRQSVQQIVSSRPPIQQRWVPLFLFDSFCSDEILVVVFGWSAGWRTMQFQTGSC